MRRIEEIAYLFATQKASVNVTSNLKLMQTSAIEFMRAMNSSGLVSAILMNIGRRLRRNKGIALLSAIQNYILNQIQAKPVPSRNEIPTGFARSPPKGGPPKNLH